MRLIYLVTFLFSILISLNVNGNEFEYDKEVIPVFNKKYDTCYYTIKKPGDSYFISTKDDESCDDFLSFNKIIENKMPDKARLPFNGQIEGINFYKRLTKTTFYEEGKIKGSEYYKNGRLVYINDTNTETINFFDIEKKARMILNYGEDLYSYVLLIDDKIVLDFFPEFNDKPNILEENIANIIHNFKTFKFKIQLNKDDTIKSYYFYSEILEDLDLVIYHDDFLRSFYSYEAKDNQYKLNRINFYYSYERILQLYFSDDDYSNYRETRYLKAGDKNFYYIKENIYNDKWICKDKVLNKEVNSSECLAFDQSYYNEIMDIYFNNYNYPLIPDKIFEELGFK